jgi:hypothetical protein
MTQLIGITGRAGVGKDTAGDYLVKEHNFARYAFADPIKHMLTAGLAGVGLSMASFTDRALKEHPLHAIGKSPRELAQTLGTEWGRQLVHPDIWLILADAAWRDVEACNAAGLVITDVRFDNEAEWIINQGGRVVRITREQAQGVTAHASESGVHDDLILVDVENDGTVAELHRELDYLINPFIPLVEDMEAAR